MNGIDAAVLVQFITDAFDDVCALEPDLSVGLETEELLGRLDHEIIAFDVYLSCEAYGMRLAIPLITLLCNGKVLYLNIDELTLGEVVDNHLDGVKHCHNSIAAGVQVLAHTMLKHC